MQPIESPAAVVAVVVSLIVAWSAAAAEPMIVEIWPGKVPDESGQIGPERGRMSPQLVRKEVEVTEPTRMCGTAMMNERSPQWRWWICRWHKASRSHLLWRH